jgi:hypothetical protein
MARILHSSLFFKRLCKNWIPFGIALSTAPAVIKLMTNWNAWSKRRSMAEQPPAHYFALLETQVKRLTWAAEEGALSSGGADDRPSIRKADCPGRRF